MVPQGSDVRNGVLALRQQRLPTCCICGSYATHTLPWPAASDLMCAAAANYSCKERIFWRMALDFKIFQKEGMLFLMVFVKNEESNNLPLFGSRCFELTSHLWSKSLMLRSLLASNKLSSASNKLRTGLRTCSLAPNSKTFEESLKSRKKCFPLAWQSVKPNWPAQRRIKQRGSVDIDGCGLQVQRIQEQSRIFISTSKQHHTSRTSNKPCLTE